LRARLKQWYEKFEDIKGVIKGRKLKDNQHNGEKKKVVRQTIIHKTLHIHPKD
jgi:hypothetical protein